MMANMKCKAKTNFTLHISKTVNQSNQSLIPPPLFHVNAEPFLLLRGLLSP